MASLELTPKARIQIEEFILHKLHTAQAFDSAKEGWLRSELRKIIVESSDPSSDLIGLSSRPQVCAALFREPKSGDRTGVSRRLQSFREFLEFALPSADARNRIDAIENLLIPRRTREWDEAERIAGGRPHRSERAVRLVFVEELLAATVKAKEGKSPGQAQRDSALVSLLCFSPLRWQELVKARWEDIAWHEGESEHPFAAWYTCRRRDIELQLPVHRRATESLGVLFALSKRVMDRQPSGAIFRSMRHPYAPLQYRDAKQIADDILARAGLRAVARSDLLAGYAYHLKTRYGFTHPDLREALGYSEVKHVRNLLLTHEAWELNKTIDSMGGPIPGLEESTNDD